MAAVEIAPLRFIAVEPPRLRPDDPGTNVWRDDEGGVVALSASVGEWRWLMIEGAGSYRFPLEGGAASVSAEVVPVKGADPLVVTDSYYRSVVPLALQAHGLEVLHGSAVAIGGRVVALCAQRESGKSTLAYALQRRGARAVADDAVVVAIDRGSGSPAPVVKPVPFVLRLREPSAEHFGSRSKAEVTVGEQGSQPASEPLPLTAVVLLDRRPGEIGVSRLSASETFPALLAQAHAFSLADVARKRAMMANYLTLARTVPVYRLSYPTGLNHLGAICERIERLAGP